MKLLAYRLGGWMIFLLLVITCRTGFAQDAPQKYFIYIQNETGTPFYVKKDNQVLSSTHAGYIIIPQLKQGNYQLTIGLPGNQVPEASFDIDLSGTGDKGYLLKAADKKLHLYTLKDLSAVKPVAVASAAGNRIVDIPEPEATAKPEPAKESDSLDDLLATTESSENSSPTATATESTPAPPADTSAFARMLNEITGKNTPAAPQAEPVQQPEAEKPAPEADKNITAVAIPADSNTDNQPVQEFDRLAAQITQSKETPEEPTPEKKTGEPKSDISFITFPETGRQPGQSTPAATAMPSADDVSAVDKEARRRLEKEQRRKERRAKRAEHTPDFANMQPVESEEDNNKPVEQAANNDTKTTTGIPNSDCRELADEDQFQKVRRKMASRTDDAGIFRVAEKYLKDDECYSSQQIQSLTYLFASDEYRYKFLELAYPHVYDSGHYPGLVKTLNSSYYKGRFNALVGR